MCTNSPAISTNINACGDAALSRTASWTLVPRKGLMRWRKGHEIVASTGELFTDGSGGPAYAPREAAKAGSGIAAIKWDTNVEGRRGVSSVALAGAEVPGRQTVPRAELFAIDVAADYVAEGASLTVNADASYVVDTMNKDGSRERARQGTNGALWSRLLDKLQHRGNVCTMRKVKAHLSLADIVRGHGTVEDILGNQVADAAAGAAAERALTDSDHAQTVERWTQRAFKIAQRLAVIECWHWQQEPQLVPVPQPLAQWEQPQPYTARKQLEEDVAAKGHVLRRVGNQMVCGRCHKKRDVKQYRYWTANQCRAVCLGAAKAAPGTKRRAEEECLREPSANRGRFCAGPDDYLDEDMGGYDLNLADGNDDIRHEMIEGGNGDTRDGVEQDEWVTDANGVRHHPDELAAPCLTWGWIGRNEARIKAYRRATASPYYIPWWRRGTSATAAAATTEAAAGGTATRATDADGADHRRCADPGRCAPGAR